MVSILAKQDDLAHLQWCPVELPLFRFRLDILEKFPASSEAGSPLRVGISRIYVYTASWWTGAYSR